MRCTKDDIAIVLRSASGLSEGKLVDVVEYIGYFQANEVFDYGQLSCRVPITDHYWWIECDRGFETAAGLTRRAYSPDIWLLPQPKDLLDEDETTDLTIEHTEKV